MLKFQKLSSDLLYDSNIVALYSEKLKTPKGNIVNFDYVKHKSGGGAAALIVDEQEYTYLVKQYRNTLDEINIEIPAGGYSYVGESGQDCALREVEEEIGFIPQNMYHISNTISSVGAYDEKTDIYIGTNLIKGERKLDPDEYIEILHISIDEAIDMIFSGEIIDSKTIIALLAYKNLKSKGIF